RTHVSGTNGARQVLGGRRAGMTNAPPKFRSHVLVPMMIKPRAAAGLSQEALAEKVGRDRASVNQYENLQYRPPVEVIEAWFEACGQQLVAVPAAEGVADGATAQVQRFLGL